MGSVLTAEGTCLYHVLASLKCPAEDNWYQLMLNCIVILEWLANFNLIYWKVKGAMRFGTFKSIDFKKNWNDKVPVVPRSLML